MDSYFYVIVLLMYHIDALLYDAPCKSEFQPVTDTFNTDTNFVHNWNATRMFKPLMENESYYVSVL